MYQSFPPIYGLNYFLLYINVCYSSSSIRDGAGQFKVAKLGGLAVYHHCNCEAMLDPNLPLHETAR